MCTIGTLFIEISSLIIFALDLTKLQIKFSFLISDWLKDIFKGMENIFLIEKEKILPELPVMLLLTPTWEFNNRAEMIWKALDTLLCTS